MRSDTDKRIKAKKKEIAAQKKEIAKNEDALKLLESKKQIADDRQKAEIGAKVKQMKTGTKNLDNVLKKLKSGK